MKNAVGREIPENIPGLNKIRPFEGAFAYQPTGRLVGPKIPVNVPRTEKTLKSIDQAIEATGLRDGMTISFHHHFRNGDYVMLMVIEAVARKGIKDLTIAPSSLSAVQDCLIPYIDRGVITAIETSGIREKLGDLVCSGKLSKPVIIRTHGGRARAIESGETHIDVAFIGAPACDTYGNINGVDGPSACGSLGYPMVDAAYADRVVAITDNLVPHPLYPISIPQSLVDFIVVVDKIGDPNGIATGSLRISNNPKEQVISRYAAEVIEYSGYFKDSFSLQLGSGGASLTAAKFIKEKMLKQKIAASFGVGGITGVMVEMHEQGLIKRLFDTQTFDTPSIRSLKENPCHVEVSASLYANPHSRGPIVNNVDFVILSATEVDVDFNVNVLTGSTGRLMGAPGGHPDTSAGSSVSIIVLPLIRGRRPMIQDRVYTVVTPGETVDVIVTDYGVSVNPKRKDLIDNLRNSSLPVMKIEELQRKAYQMTGIPTPPLPPSDEVVAVVEYRDGSIIDVIRKSK
ncbi:citrate lyase subunit alpha [Candidatus Formimonas warabiya]|uniref:Citrate lyase alpha chain n=1 Tax=Formimonas warabiya TaxID=1761012 RepID=A0A3G1KR95_FORW1|nr:citrate lyase subunit alpha [Candidatus Formimonas warabiya]ATW24984.1 citrate lyase subunit alpha [Candidatus Formimonas warabiya]